MGLSRMASKCNICPQRDRCSRKRMEGLGYIQPATTDVAEAAAAPVLKKHRYYERDHKARRGIEPPVLHTGH